MARQGSEQRSSARSALALLVGGTACFALVMVVMLLLTSSPTGGTAQDADSPQTAGTHALKTEIPVVEDTPRPLESPDAPGEGDATPAEPTSAEPTPDASATRFARLQEDVERVASSAGMQVGASVLDLTTGAAASYHGSDAQVSASMIKLVVAAAYLEQVAAGVLDLDATYTLQQADLVGGTGSLVYRGAGAAVSYRELLTKMLSQSDNTAANVLIRTVGMEAVNAEAVRLGLSATRLNRLMMDEEAMAAGIENYTSADDCALLLKMAYEGTLVSPEASALILRALEQQEDAGGVLAGLPAGTIFAHKTGALATYRHDGGIVEGDHPFVLVVLCGGEGFYEQGALDVMACIASTVYEDFSR